VTDRSTGAAPLPERDRALDRTFEVTVVLKGLDGLLETVGGLLLLLVSPSSLNSLAARLTQHELSRDPHDWFAHRLLHATANLDHTRTFGALYLLSHGVAKIVLAVALLRRQRWAYPATLVFLGAFVVYQIYRMTYAPSVGLALLTAFDLAIMILTWREYRRLPRPPDRAPFVPMT